MVGGIAQQRRTSLFSTTARDAVYEGLPKDCSGWDAAGSRVALRLLNWLLPKWNYNRQASRGSGFGKGLERGAFPKVRRRRSQAGAKAPLLTQVKSRKIFLSFGINLN